MKTTSSTSQRFRLAIFLVLAICRVNCHLAAEEPREAESGFQELADAYWEFRMESDPLFATSAGDHRYNDQLPTRTIEAITRDLTRLEQFQQQLDELDPSELTSSTRINYAVLRRMINDELTGASFHDYLIPITNREGFHVSFPDLRNQVPLRDEQDYRDFITRLSKFKTYTHQQIDLMRQGIREGMTLPSAVLSRYREPIVPHIVDDPANSLFFEPFRELPDRFSEATKEALRREAAAAIRDSIVSGYADFLEFMEQEYLPAARDSLAAAALPNGREYYRHRVRHYTTLDLSPAEVHQIGMSEVSRIRNEMQQIIDKLEFDGDVPQFAEHLRNDERFQPRNADELMKEASFVLKQMDGKLPLLFRTLPRTPYGLTPIPDYIAPETTSAYYMPPPGDGSRAGQYFLNTYDLKSRPLYEIQALSLHEAVPGHHLQIALQQELKELPPYRRFSGFTAYVEGWALYAERLGLEVGFYQDPYSDFGRLTYEMWRACRLVVDSGIHDLGWSREQAIQFMEDNTALSKHNIRAEVDRYIAWPGQALGYKIGELKIRELRARAEAELGDRFDLREFHDAVLLQGSLPLDVLAEQIDQWIREVQTRPS